MRPPPLTGRLPSCPLGSLHPLLAIPILQPHLLLPSRVPSMPCLLPAFISRYLVLGWPPSTHLQLNPTCLPKHQLPIQEHCPSPSHPACCCHPSLVQSRERLNKQRAVCSHRPTSPCWQSCHGARPPVGSRRPDAGELYSPGKEVRRSWGRSGESQSGAHVALSS